MKKRKVKGSNKINYLNIFILVIGAFFVVAVFSGGSPRVDGEGQLANVGLGGFLGFFGFGDDDPENDIGLDEEVDEELDCEDVYWKCLKQCYDNYGGDYNRPGYIPCAESCFLDFKSCGEDKEGRLPGKDNEDEKEEEEFPLEEETDFA